MSIRRSNCTNGVVLIIGMRSAERRKANVLEMKCLRSLVGVSLDKVSNEEVHRRAGIERSSRVERIREY